jgi:hypothetical protein
LITHAFYTSEEYYTRWYVWYTIQFQISFQFFQFLIFFIQFCLVLLYCINFSVMFMLL